MAFQTSILTAYLQADASTPFDLVEGPPIRARLFKLSETDHALVVTAHHIICDGWSVNVIVTELAKVYASLREQRSPDLGPVMPFTEYARARSARTTDEQAAVATYWAAQFANPTRPIDLPTDRPRPTTKSYAGASASHRIDTELYRAVKAAGARQGCSLFVTLLAAFEALMGRLAGVEELVVAVPTAGQSLIEDKALVGHCVNFLPIRGGWVRETPFLDHLRSVSRRVLDAYEHQDYTLGTIVRKLALSREVNRLPLTELQFNLERLPNRIEAGGLAIDVEPNAKAFVNFDIFWNVIESPDGLRIDCDYNTDLFDKATIDRWLVCYEALLEAIVSNPNERVTRVPYIPRAQLQQIIDGFNATSADYPRERCVHDLIEQQACATPDAVALAFDGATVRYRDLDERANRLAHHLRARIGSDGGRIGVLVERSPDMVMALLAIWKAGFAYVPLDPAHPPARLRYILSNAGVSGVVAGGLSGELALPPEVTIVDLGREREAIEGRPAAAAAAAMNADTSAYLIYTSGSTGAPKGVEVSHRSLVNLLCSVADRPGIGGTDTLLAITTIAFDIAALELFAPLLAGGTVAIARREDVLDGNRLLAAVARSEATILQATPASWRLLLEAGFRSRPGFKMMCGGEALPRDLADRLLDGGGALWNMYGPTETTIWSSCGEVTAGDDPITIGRPIVNTQLHVLDRYDQPVPFGLSGELHIGGDGVAKGYFRQEVLTAEKFIPDPFKLSDRLYRTGDIARRLPSGEIQLLGRADTQIKLRGFRIELEEIEAVLSRRVGLAAVALREDTANKPILVGYLAGAPTTASSDEVVRSSLAEDLPDYMIPSIWVRLEIFAADPEREDRSRRAARARCRRPAGTGVRSAGEPTRSVPGLYLGGGSQGRPRRPRQRPVLPRRQLYPSVPDRRARQSPGDPPQRAAVARSSNDSGAGGVVGDGGWRDLPRYGIAREPIATPVSACRERAHSNVSHAQTIVRPDGGVSANTEGSDVQSAVKTRRDVQYPASLAQQRFWLLDKLEPRNPALNIAVRWRIEGDLPAELIEKAFVQIVERHEPLRTSFVDIDGEPFQVVQPEVSLRVPSIDLTVRSEAEALRGVRSYRAKRGDDAVQLGNRTVDQRHACPGAARCRHRARHHTSHCVRRLVHRAAGARNGRHLCGTAGGASPGPTEFADHLWRLCRLAEGDGCRRRPCAGDRLLVPRPERSRVFRAADRFPTQNNARIDGFDPIATARPGPDGQARYGCPPEWLHAVHAGVRRSGHAAASLYRRHRHCGGHASRRARSDGD